MSRRNGTFKINENKPVKNCGSTVITPKTKGDVPAAKTVRNVHVIGAAETLHKAGFSNGELTKALDLLTKHENIFHVADFVNPEIEKRVKDEASPLVSDIDKVYSEQLTPEQEKALYTEEEQIAAAYAVSSSPIKVVNKRGRKTKEEVVSTNNESLSPANNESEPNKE